MKPYKVKHKPFCEPKMERKFLKFYEDSAFRYQMPHIQNLKNTILSKGIAFDVSPTGVGKTFSAVWCALLCGFKTHETLILSPRKIVKIWGDIYKDLFLEPPTITTKEFITKNIKNVDDLEPFKKYKMIIFDEAHGIKNRQTKISKVIRFLRGGENPPSLLCLSATLIDHITQMEGYGEIIGKFKYEKFNDTTLNGVFNKYEINHRDKVLVRKLYTENGISEEAFNSFRSVFKKKSKRFNKKIYEEADTRRVWRILEPFKHRMERRKIKAEDFIKKMSIDDDVLSKKVREGALELDQINNVQIKSFELQQDFIRKLQEFYLVTEAMKIDIIYSKVKHCVCKKNRNVVFFCLRRENTEKLAGLLKQDKIPYSKMVGGDSEGKRTRAIDDFQTGKSRVFISTLGAGSESISLHDTTGKHPRVSFISVNYNSVSYQQSLGRINRAGQVSNSYQFIVVVEKTFETKIYEKIMHKVKNYETINA